MRITAGSKDTIAIEVELESTRGDWIPGHFLLWCNGAAIGDWDDSADIRGVVRWMRDLADRPRDRREPSLDDCSKEEVFRRVLEPVMASSSSQSTLSPIPNAFARFVISHIGMSALDAYDVLLLEAAEGRERVLWRHRDGPIEEAWLGPSEIERVARELAEKVAAAIA